MSESVIPRADMREFEEDLTANIGEEQMDLGFVPIDADPTIGESVLIEKRVSDLKTSLHESFTDGIVQYEAAITDLQRQKARLEARREFYMEQFAQMEADAAAYRQLKMEVDARVAGLNEQIASIGIEIEAKVAEHAHHAAAELEQKGLERTATRNIHTAEDRLIALKEVIRKNEERISNPQSWEDQAAAVEYYTDHAYRGVNALSPAQKEEYLQLQRNLEKYQIAEAEADTSARQHYAHTVRLELEMEQLRTRREELIAQVRTIESTEQSDLKRELRRIEGGLNSAIKRFNVEIVEDQGVEPEAENVQPDVEMDNETPVVVEEDLAVTALHEAVRTQRGDAAGTSKRFGLFGRRR